MIRAPLCRDAEKQPDRGVVLGQDIEGGRLLLLEQLCHYFGWCVPCLQIVGEAASSVSSGAADPMLGGAMKFPTVSDFRP